jgi:hypothetical protein
VWFKEENRKKEKIVEIYDKLEKMLIFCILFDKIDEKNTKKKYRRKISISISHNQCLLEQPLTIFKL